MLEVGSEIVDGEKGGMNGDEKDCLGEEVVNTPSIVTATVEILINRSSPDPECC